MLRMTLLQSTDPLGPVRDANPDGNLTASRAGIEPGTYMARVGRVCTSPQPGRQPSRRTYQSTSPEKSQPEKILRFETAPTQRQLPNPVTFTAQVGL